MRPFAQSARFDFLDLGARPYEEVWALQKELVSERQQGRGKDTILFVEHPPVYTLGRRFYPDDFRRPFSEAEPTLDGVPVLRIERGGRITFHGPGQLVVYPILRLEPREQHLYRLLRGFEEILIQLLASYGVAAERRHGQTGVFTPDGKIASIGIAVRRWVTFHGLCLNLTTDLAYFDKIVACGLVGVRAVRLADYLPAPPPRAELLRRFTDRWLALWPSLFHD